MSDHINKSSLERYTTGDAMVEALQEMGVSYLFCNLGSDHPAIIEGLAKAKIQNRPLPQVIICPHEYVALSAAHGYALLTGEAQAVLVHTDVGTQNLGGAVHNASRSRVPVFIFAGETPYTMEGEWPGSRNNYVNHLQDVVDQAGIVRSYVKWEYNLRTGRNVKQLIYRGFQLAQSDPQGPVYVMGAREVMEEDVTPLQDRSGQWKAVEKIPLPAGGVEQIVNCLAHAINPLVVTTYVGRNEKAVTELVKLCETLAIPVVESFKSCMNFPTEHPLHLGFTAGELVSKADVILVIDSDCPWVATLQQPSDDCQIFYIDLDPLKEDMPLWYMPSTKFYRADSYEALLQLNSFAKGLHLDQAKMQDRYSRWSRLHEEQRSQWKKKEQTQDDVITPAYLTTCLREVIDDDTIVLNETITNAASVYQHLPRSKPGTFFCNGGSSLGWNGGAAFGAKLAKPDKTVVSLTGDGSYLFSIPSSLHWMSRKYNAPFLTVIYNNQGWNATKQNVLKLYPDGLAKQHDQYWVNFDQPADLAKIAEAAGGAFAQTVYHPDELPDVLRQGINEVRNGRSAVIDVRLARISNQKD